MTTPSLADSPILIADLRDEDALLTLGMALHAWEPALELELRREDARPYDADATDYLFPLQVGAIEVNRRRISVAPGDLIVQPAAFAIDVDPPLDFVALRHFGGPPRHHRERFLQVEGVDHLALSVLVDPETRHDGLFTSNQKFHRVEYAPLSGLDVYSSGLDALIGFVSTISIRVADRILEIDSPSCLLIGPGCRVQTSKAAMASFWRISPEPVYEARRWS